MTLLDCRRIQTPSFIASLLMGAVVSSAAAYGADAAASISNTGSHSADVSDTGFPDSREALALRGVDETSLAALASGAEVSTPEIDTILKTLFAVSRFTPSEMDRWATAVPARSLGTLELPPRGLVFRLAGSINRIEPAPLAPEIAERLGFREYYRCRLTIEPGNQAAEIWVLDVPEAWRSGGDVAERVSAMGVFLKTTSSDTSEPRPLFVAERVAWFPDSLLGRLGMDVGLFDRLTNRARLSIEESECFYQLLAACGHVDIATLEQEVGRNPTSVVPLFNQPDSQFGRPVLIDGIVRRAVEVRIENPDVVERFRFDHYYEVEMFTSDSQSNPIVCCVRQLPQGMPRGNSLYEHARVYGFFFKVWAYPRSQSAKASTAEARQALQLAPLVVGPQLQWYSTRQPPAAPVWSILLGIGFVVVLAGLWLSYFRLGAVERKNRKRWLAQPTTIELPPSSGDSAVEPAAQAHPQDDPPSQTS